MDLISDRLNNQLNNLIGKSFSINRMLDRGMSLLMVRWTLINSSKILHNHVAHAYPGDKFADSISDYQGSRNMESIYPETPIGNRDYENPLSFFKDYLAENIEFEDMIKDAIDMAIEDGDHTTKVFLDGLLMRLSPYTALSQDLVNLFDNYGNNKFNLQVLDSVIEKYINV